MIEHTAGATTTADGANFDTDLIVHVIESWPGGAQTIDPTDQVNGRCC
jgi:hypothetical protein